MYVYVRVCVCVCVREMYIRCGAQVSEIKQTLNGPSASEAGETEDSANTADVSKTGQEVVEAVSASAQAADSSDRGEESAATGEACVSSEKSEGQEAPGTDSADSCAKIGAQKRAREEVNSDAEGKRTKVEVEVPPNCNLFVYHCPLSWDDSMLNACFRAFGTILTAKVMTHKATGASKGFGFVGYDNAASALKAIDAMNGYEVSGKRLKVQLKSEGKGHGKEEEEHQHGPAGCNLFVYYCPDSWGDEDMKEVSYIVVYTTIYTTMCPHTTIYTTMCPHYYYMSSHYYICVLMALMRV